jgi:quercetin dioxygenase-like cupin family protein
MSRKTLKRLVAGALVVCAAGAITWRAARATPPFAVLSNIILAGPIPFDKITALNFTPDYAAVVWTSGESDTYVQDITIAPGGYSGWHSHPGHAFVMVRSGTASFYQASDPATPQVYPAGTGFVEEPWVVHNAVNEGDTNLEMFVFYLLPKGAPRRIDQPAPH